MCDCSEKLDASFIHLLDCSENTSANVDSSYKRLPKSQIRLTGDYRRVEPGTFDIDRWFAKDFNLIVEKGSFDHLHADQVPRTILKPGNRAAYPDANGLVPVDCFWAIMNQPISIEHGSDSRKIQERYQSLFPVQGRTFEEIDTVLGPENAMAYVWSGPYLNASWGKSTLFSTWLVTLTFDRYRICIGITDEMSL